MGWRITFGGTLKQLSPEEAEDPHATRWEGGTPVDLDDLSPEVWDKIAEVDDTNGWYGIYLRPAATSGRLYAVICAAAEHAGLDVPERPSNMRDAKRCLAMIEQTEDIEEKPFVGDFPPTPSDAETA